MCLCIVLDLFYCKLHVCKSPSICFQGTKYEINQEDVVYLHCRRFYSDNWVWFLNSETVKDVEGITKAKYPIETRNDRLLVFLTSADSLTSEIFVDFWLSLDMSIGTCTFSRVSMT